MTNRIVNDCKGGSEINNNKMIICSNYSIRGKYMKIVKIDMNLKITNLWIKVTINKDKKVQFRKTRI